VVAFAFEICFFGVVGEHIQLDGAYGGKAGVFCEQMHVFSFDYDVLDLV
jgi:hypothetical protein